MKEIIPFVFEGHQIRVIRDENGEPNFVGKDICEALGYVNHIDAMKLHCKGVVKRYPLQTAGGKQNVRVLTEGDMYRLMTHSTLESAERFESLVFDEILPTIRKTGKYEAKQEKVTTADKARFDMTLKLARVAMVELNMAPSGRLMMLKQVETTYGLPATLPNYADDNNGSTVGSMETAALTDLLREFNAGISCQKANLVLMNIGFLKEAQRPSRKSPNKVAKFKVIDGDGLKYGKNSTNPSNPRETQPLWYRDTFGELMSIIFDNSKVAA